MRMSQLFGQTLREAPLDSEIVSHQLLVRAAFIRQLGAGIFTYLHLAQRSITKIEAILRAEMNAIGGQEIMMPVVHPADIWKETGRWYQIGAEMGRFRDKHDRDMVLAMTHEEVVADLVRKEIQSYKQLPRLIYHLQTKWRDDPRPRAGLIRVREFTMKDSYSLDVDWAGLETQYQAHYQAYFRIFRRCGLPVVAVKADIGMMGGKLAHEFMYLTPIGEDTLLLCDSCHYTANRQIATFQKARAADEPPRPAERIATPGITTIAGLAQFLNVPRSKTAKAVFMIATLSEGADEREQLVLAIIRGDMEVNETKLANAVKAKQLRPAREEEIRAAATVPGYASPIGLINVLVVVDDMIPSSPNLVAGANQEGFHLLHVNYGTDYTAEVVADIAVAEEGAACPRCGAALRTARGVEVGNIFQLGTRYTDAMGCTFLDSAGQTRPVVMGSYGIGVGRLLACIAEEHHDAQGLCWPISVAPYPVHLVALQGGEAVAEHLYSNLQMDGIDVLYDDRVESPGVKFNDADLIGNPVRLTASKRSLERGGVELKLRRGAETVILSVDEVVAVTKSKMVALAAEVADTVEPPRYIPD